MGQIKIYGHKRFIQSSKKLISKTIHESTVEVLGLPENKKFHRFLELEDEMFIHPGDRTDQYIIIEALLISGRSKETKKNYINSLINRLSQNLNLDKNDIEITLIDVPIENWGIRGLPADELALNYQIKK